MATRLSGVGWRERAKRIPFLAAAVRTVRAVINPEFRNLWRLQRDRQSGLLQPSSMTRANRYPELFTFLKHTLADVTSLRLLSYGCSTGEEVFSLRALFPTADITGVDINPHSISVAERHLAQHPSPGIAFECASSPAGLPAGHYDAILCMAVLQHGALRQNPPSSCADYIRFADVAAIVTGLAHCLKPGGLLVIWNSHFRFADMPAAAGFDTVWQVPPQLAGDTLYYGPDNIRLTGDNGGIDYYGDIVFRKRNCQPGPL